MNRLEQGRLYRLKNKEKLRLQKKEYYLKNIHRLKEYYKKIDKERSEAKKLAREERRKKEPWIFAYKAARRRCLDNRIREFKYYGGKGVKFLLSIEEIKFLWIRDKAQNMKKPTIDRIDSEGNYEFINCRFIEHSENVRRGNIKRWSSVGIV